MSSNDQRKKEKERERLILPNKFWVLPDFGKIYSEFWNVGYRDEEKLDEELDMAFPISRVRGILKADEDNKLLAKDVLFYFEKATVNKITHTI